MYKALMLSTKKLTSTLMFGRVDHWETFGEKKSSSVPNQSTGDLFDFFLNVARVSLLCEIPVCLFTTFGECLPCLNFIHVLLECRNNICQGNRVHNHNSSEVFWPLVNNFKTCERTKTWSQLRRPPAGLFMAGLQKKRSVSNVSC